MAATAATTEEEAAEATTSAAPTLDPGGRPGDGAAAARVAELFERHGGTVLGLCRVLLRDPHEAEDAVQQTFLAAYRSLLGGTEPRHPAAWLATIARNECWAQARRRMREPVTEQELEGELPDPVVAAARRADLAALWLAIGELPRRQRRALLLREFSGLSYDELAVVLGVSEPAVESLLVRARRQLRVRLRPLQGATPSVALLAGIRDLLSIPLATKLAAGAALVMVAGGTVAAVEQLPLRHDVGAVPAEAATVQSARPRETGSLSPAVTPVVTHTVRDAAPGAAPAPSRPASAPKAAALPSPAPVVAPRTAPPVPTGGAPETPAHAGTPPAATPEPGTLPAPTGGGTETGEDGSSGGTEAGGGADDPSTTTPEPGDDSGSSTSDDGSSTDDPTASGEEASGGASGGSDDSTSAGETESGSDHSGGSGGDSGEASGGSGGTSGGDD